MVLGGLDMAMMVGGGLVLAMPGMGIWGLIWWFWHYFNKKEHIYNKLYIFPFLLRAFGIKKTS